MKYTVLMSCGHEETIDLVGKNSERERKIEYFKAYSLCKECYKRTMAEKSVNEPFTFHMTVLPYIDKENGNICLSVWFSGNTKPYKDAIKTLGGYSWSGRESAEDYFSIVIGNAILVKSKKCNRSLVCGDRCGSKKRNRDLLPEFCNHRPGFHPLLSSNRKGYDYWLQQCLVSG